MSKTSLRNRMRAATGERAAVRQVVDRRPQSGSSVLVSAVRALARAEEEKREVTAWANALRDRLIAYVGADVYEARAAEVVARVRAVSLRDMCHPLDAALTIVDEVNKTHRHDPEWAAVAGSLTLAVAWLRWG